MPKDIKIMIAMHKPYRAAQDDIYYPVHVGALGKEDFQVKAAHDIMPDSRGDNISAKNPNFCELTGLYYMWKNVSSDYLGLSHYRRYFAQGKNKDKWKMIAGRQDAERKPEQGEPEDLPYGHVERIGRLSHHDGVGPKVFPAHPSDAVHRRSVADDRALGDACGAGRIDHIQRIVRQRGAGRNVFLRLV